MAPPQMTPEEAALDEQWRTRFGQPLPILGCADIVRQILQTSSPTHVAG